MPRDKNRFVHIPAAFAKLMRGALDWDYLTEPQQDLGGRQIYWPRGKMLGGSSSMNAMMWVRGFAADYDEWGEHAGEQWNYARTSTHRPTCAARIGDRSSYLAPAQSARLDRGLADRGPGVRPSHRSSRIKLGRKGSARRV